MTGLAIWCCGHARRSGWARLSRPAEAYGGAPLVSNRALVHAGEAAARALGPWALDSGGFTELAWQTTPKEYVDATRRYRDAIEARAWAAPQDWMGKPFMLKKTGRPVAEHQRLTVANFLTLREIAPDLLFVPSTSWSRRTRPTPARWSVSSRVPRLL